MRSYKIVAYESDSRVNAKVSMRSSFFKCEPWKRWYMKQCKYEKKSIKN